MTSIAVTVSGFNGQKLGTSTLCLPPIDTRQDFCRMLMGGDDVMDREWRAFVYGVNTQRPPKGTHVDKIGAAGQVDASGFVRDNRVLHKMWLQTSDLNRWLLVTAFGLNTKPPEILASLSTFKSRRAAFVEKLKLHRDRGILYHCMPEARLYFPEIKDTSDIAAMCAHVNEHLTKP